MHVTLINVGDIIAYGLRCVSSQLLRHGVETSLVFIPPRFAEIAHPNLLPGILDVARRSAFVGLSVMAGQFKSAVYLTEHLRRDAGIPVCWGGIHPTISPEMCIEHADIICLGEAEDTVVSLARRLEAGEDLDDLPGVWFRTNGEVKRNRNAGIPTDLNAFPPPDHDFSSHHIFDYKTGSMERMDADQFFKYRGRRYTTLPTRGCAMNCTYCVNNYLHKTFPGSNRLRYKSVANLVAELAWVKEHLPFIEEIDFYDDDFLLLPIDYLREFADAYAASVNLPLEITGISPHNFSRDKLDLLREKVTIPRWRLGIQSGSERARKEIYNRRHPNEKLVPIIDYFSQFRNESLINYDIILENPWETEEDLEETFRFLMRIPKPFKLITYYLTFYPGTALYERASREGLLNSGNDGFSQKYQTPRESNKLNSIIASIDKLPRWLLLLMFHTRHVPVLSDILQVVARGVVGARRWGRGLVHRGLSVVRGAMRPRWPRRAGAWS